MKKSIETEAALPWTAARAPGRVLIIRFQAFGDIVGILPAVQGLRGRLPDASLELLTRADFLDIPRSLALFDRIHTIGGRRNRFLQQVSAGLALRRLRQEPFDLVIDLQDNRISRYVRSRLRCIAWSAFDRSSPLPHAERARRTIGAALPGDNALDFTLRLRTPDRGAGHIPAEARGRELVALNPAGYFTTRNWPLENYLEFARLWLERRNRQAVFVILGLPRIAEKAKWLERALGGACLNLVGKISPSEALAVLQRVSLVLSEDSGLMHMAWVSGRPTLALFGSSRSDWSGPLGPHTGILDSSDLPCGACMQAECRFGDVRCLTRHTPAAVFESAVELLKRHRATHK